MTEEFNSLDITPDEFREVGHRTIELLADHFEHVRDVDPFPGKTPAEVAATFDDPLPVDGEHPDRILDDWSERIYPNAAHTGSPRWFGYVKGSGSQIGVVADALAAGVNMNVWGWIGGPAATEIERRSIAWLAEMIGYPADCGGVLTSGGTMANHAAIYAALQEATDHEAATRGLRSLDDGGRFTLYTSAHEAHSSVEHVAGMVGVGTESIRYVPCDDGYRMDPAALAEYIEADAEAGDVPFCVVAQAGSINVGAVDPLREIARVCDDHDVWFHADGACGAVGAMLPEKRHLFDGLDVADSVTMDPHKWLSVPYSCGCVLFRDPVVQSRTFAMDADYLDAMADDAYHGTNFSSLGPELSRPFRALKVWMSLKHRGLAGYRQLLRQNVRCAELLHDLVVEAEDFEAVQEPVLFIYSFRYLPTDLREAIDADLDAKDAIDDYADRLNQRITDEVRLTGEAFLTTTSVGGRTVLRMSICSHRTEPADIETTFRALRTHGERIDGEERGDLLDASASAREE